MKIDHADSFLWRSFFLYSNIGGHLSAWPLDGKMSVSQETFVYFQIYHRFL